jgi:hypothetical protein
VDKPVDNSVDNIFILFLLSKKRKNEKLFFNHNFLIFFSTFWVNRQNGGAKKFVLWHNIDKKLT